MSTGPSGVWQRIRPQDFGGGIAHVATAFTSGQSEQQSNGAASGGGGAARLSPHAARATNSNDNDNQGERT